MQHRPAQGACTIATIASAIMGLIMLSSAQAQNHSPTQTKLRLAKDWNLKTFRVRNPSDSHPVLLALNTLGIRIWEASSLGAPPILNGDAALHEATRISADTGYWVWSPVDQEIALPDPNQRKAVSPEWTQPTESQDASLSSGWHFLPVFESVHYGDGNIDRILHWDADTQRYQRIGFGETLHPTEGYWGYLLETGTPFAASCLTETWTLVDAVEIVEGCPVSSGRANIIPRSGWGIHGANTSTTSSRGIVLHHTRTSPDLSITEFESLQVDPNLGLDLHFVIAKDKRGQWQIFEDQGRLGAAVQLPSNAQGFGVVEEIHIAIMGNYELAATEEPNKTNQPPRNAVLRLLELVAFLRAHTDVHQIVAHDKKRDPGRATHHLITALENRFFNSPVTPESETNTPPATGAPESKDITPPLLVVLSPSETNTEIAGPFITIEGEVFDEQLATLSINGVAVAASNKRFRHAVHLSPKHNVVQILATDRAGNQTQVERQIYRRPATPTESASPENPKTPLDLELGPVITLSQPLHDRVYVRDPVVRISGATEDADFLEWTVNGLLVGLGRDFHSSVFVTEEQSSVKVAARNLAGHTSTKTVDIILDVEAPKILLSHPRNVTVHQDQTVLKGAVGDKHFLALSWSRGPEHPSQELDVHHGFFEQDVALQEGPNGFVLTAIDRAGNLRQEEVVVTYTEAPKRGQKPLPPEALSAQVVAQTAVLTWRKPTLFADGSPLPQGTSLDYLVYRDGTQIAETRNEHAHRDELPAFEQEFRYFVIAVLRDAQGTRWLSDPSRTIDLKAHRPSPPPVPGAFETPATVGQSEGSVSLPKTALTSHLGRTYAHLAYVRPGQEAEPDRIIYQHSDKAAKANSFGTPYTIATSKLEWMITDLALAADGHLVSLGWIEQKRNEDSTGKVWVAQSSDGGRSFEAATLVRESREWKRGIDLAFDRLGQHHLVWGEASKAYYLKNLTGTPSNVFDVRKRQKATEKVKYLAYYPSTEGKGCTCDACWCEESYIISDEPDPTDNNEPIGPYLYRVEEALVYEPSLHVDQNSVTIAARQTRLWDALPVKNPAWEAMALNPLYDEKVIQRPGPTRLVVGWRKTWKKAKEPGDESQWTALSHRHQYHYEGTWHDEDQIKIAQRPLHETAWSSSARTANEDPWRVGTWINDTEQQWRITVVANIEEPARSEKPSYPRVHTLHDGQMLIAFEAGVSDNPNTPHQNPIYTAFSKDGGRHWSFAAIAAEGYMPTPAATMDGQTGLLYYAAQGDNQPGAIQFVHHQGGQKWSSPSTLSAQAPKPIHHQTHSAARLYGVPSLSSHGELFLAAWVRQGGSSAPKDQVVSARASKNTTLNHVDATLPEQITANTSVPLSVAAENKYHMRVSSSATVQIRDAAQPPRTPPGSSRTGGSLANDSETSESLTGASLANDSETSESPTDGLHTNGSAAAPNAARLPFNIADPVSGEDVDSTVSLTLSNGAATLWTTLQPTELPKVGLASAPALQESRLELQWDSGPEVFETQTQLIPNNISGNYHKALLAREDLVRTKTSVRTGQELVYQVEYQAEPTGAPPVLGNDPLNPTGLGPSDFRDAIYLAGFERVWVYTQGIALAQYARQTGPDFQHHAQGIARMLCEKAVSDPESSNLAGWPFSWNTKDDDWKDARLVTGATAWAIHGLGLFITSDAYQNIESPQEKQQLLDCYHRSLFGLETHRRHVELNDKKVVSLMSAGWTTVGLQNVQTPWNIETKGGVPLSHDERERWSYYSVLDAIGYEVFDDTLTIRYCVEDDGNDCYAQDPSSEAWQTREITSDEWDALRHRARANNVVTEHNLDVLSVLNHALNHAQELRLPKTNDIETWRNELRDGIFFGLWDD